MTSTATITSVPRIVAEIGTAHGGDIARARELIEAAAEAGADTAKFQLVRADEILHPQAGSIDLPGGSVPLYERFRELERSEEFYGELQHACEAAHLKFLCTPFGITSARILRRLTVPEYKIASPELNHIPLLREIAHYQKPIILSAGVATVRDIAEALATLPPGLPVTVLQCITAYPAPEEEYNLRAITALRDTFGVPLGVSDHSMDPILVPALATLQGASMIEKHITLSRDDAGLDDPIALEPHQFRTMVDTVRRISADLNEASRAGAIDFHRMWLEHEQQIKDQFGDHRVENVLGTGVKQLAPSEERNYGFTNRSIHAIRDIAAGDVLTEDSIAVLRTEKNLSPGVHPRYWDTLLGRHTTRHMSSGQGVTWDHLLS
ncbi:MAG TPA: N-acetylneuraminate synthase family protein [Alkalispirochaeta sp.]|nr:N-acetylneuraminate synthase family protein [Alkalispirochaeta sp.]